MLYVSHRERETRVLGPGKRYALWLQGCRKRCPGCLFPEGQPPDKNGVFVSVEEILSDILSTPGLRGVTISGGEPFLQPIPLAKLILRLRTETSLDIMIYSGYTIEELKNFPEDAVQTILNNTDILIDGEYLEELNTNSTWRGSDNQKIHFLSPKYRPFKDMIEKSKNRSIEFVCRDSGELIMIGLPAKNFRNQFMKATENLSDADDKK